MTDTHSTIANGKSKALTNLTAADIVAARPFDNDAWTWIESKQTKPFRPNRLYADKAHGVAVLVCRKSKTDYAVSADALGFLPEREAVSSSWVEAAFVMLVDGSFDDPAAIVAVEVMTAKAAAARVSGETPSDGRNGFRPYFWFRPSEEDEPM